MSKLAEYILVQLGEDKDMHKFLKMITAAALLNPELMTKGILVAALKEIEQGCRDIIALSNEKQWEHYVNKNRLEFVSCLIVLLETNQVPA